MKARGHDVASIVIYGIVPAVIAGACVFAFATLALHKPGGEAAVNGASAAVGIGLALIVSRYLRADARSS